MSGRPATAQWKLHYSEPIQEVWGRFLEWGVSYEEFETGPGNYTTAIIEDSDGRVHCPPAETVKFMDRAPGDKQEWTQMTGGKM